MNKTVITIVSIVVILTAVLVGLFFYNNIQESSQKETKIGSIADEQSEVIEDECTEEWEALNITQNNSSKVITTDSSDDKISPNCELVLRKYYKKCGHTITQYDQIPSELVNKTRKDLENEYQGWSIDSYSNTKIMLYKEYEGECGEHYVIRENEGIIIINKIDESGKEIPYDETDISLEYIPQEDKQEIENGLEVYGSEALNQFIENFE